MLADYGSGLYKTLLVLHILTSIVGLGAVMLNGLYAAQAQKRAGPGGRAVSEANYFVSNIAEKFIYAIPIFGILLVLDSDKLWKFSQTWIWLSLVVYVVAIGISHSILIPGHKRINALLAEMEQGPPSAGGPAPQVVELQATGKRMAAAGATLNVCVVIFLVLMVWKPGV
ncbi:MAG: putative integral rane protein [Actinomycetota bacterium]|nr:putative integral rane protein [Actinomycetota bacterium]